MDSSNLAEKNDLEELGLRIMLLIVECEKHKYQSKIFNKIPTFDSIVNLDYKSLESHQTFEYLANNILMNHSTIIIAINCGHFPCRAKNLRLVIKAMECNKHLRYKLKIICTFYEDFAKFTKDKDIEYSFYREAFFADYYSFIYSYLENAFLLQDCHTKSGDLMLKNVFKILEYRPYTSALELDLALTYVCAILTLSKGHVDLYFYSVNPALAIIINHYFFTNQNCGIREGSKKDVIDLIHQFRLSRTPFILIQDFKRHEILKLVEWLRQKNLKPLKCLYFITMTHGTENNIVYTNDGELNFIDDILQPIQSNVFLKNTNITFVNVHCRGSINGLYLDPEDSDIITPTKIPYLQSNTSIFYSVPDLTLSPRHRVNGTPFMNCFSKAYEKLECSSNIETLYEITNNDLKNYPYYDTLDCFGKSAELVVADDPKAHCIKPMATSATETVPCFQLIKQEFHDLFDKDNSYILNMDEKDHLPPPSISTSATKSFCLFANKDASSLLPKVPKYYNFSSCQIKLDKKLEDRILEFQTMEKSIFIMFIRAVNDGRLTKAVPVTGVIPMHNENSNKLLNKSSCLHGFAREYILEKMDEKYIKGSSNMLEDGLDKYDRLKWFSVRMGVNLKRRHNINRCRYISVEECLSY